MRKDWEGRVEVSPKMDQVMDKMAKYPIRDIKVRRIRGRSLVSL